MGISVRNCRMRDTSQSRLACQRVEDPIGGWAGDSISARREPSRGSESGLQVRWCAWRTSDRPRHVGLATVSIYEWRRDRCPPATLERREEIGGDKESPSRQQPHSTPARDGVEAAQGMRLPAHYSSIISSLTPVGRLRGVPSTRVGGMAFAMDGDYLRCRGLVY